MQHYFLSAFFIGCACFLINAPSATAQSSGGIPAGSPVALQKTAPQTGTGGAQAADPYEALNLTPEQQQQFKKIDEDYAAKKKQLRASGTGSGEALKKIRDERTAARKAVLNAAQIKKYDEIVAQNKATRAAAAQTQQETEAARQQPAPALQTPAEKSEKVNKAPAAKPVKEQKSSNR